jgi:hypothetical protein
MTLSSKTATIFLGTSHLPFTSLSLSLSVFFINMLNSWVTYRQILPLILCSIQFISVVFTISVPTSQWTRWIFIIKTSILLTSKELFNLYSEIKVAERSEAWVCGRLLAGIVSSNPTGGMYVLLLTVVCSQVEGSASGWLPVKRSPIEYGVSECDRETSTMRMPWPTRGCKKGTSTALPVHNQA